MENQEIWKDIIELDSNYMISNFGNVIRKERSVLSEIPYHKGVRLIKARKSKIQDNGNGYLQLYVSINTKRKMMYIHRLVAQYFIENTSEDKICVNHKNGLKADNNVENLEWCTHIENIKHAIDIGLINKKGENSWNCKLTEFKVLAIRRLYAINKKFNKSAVARKLGVGDELIHKIIKRERWKHI
jgi:hypothetical protein